MKLVAGSELVLKDGKIITFAEDGEIAFAGDDTEVGQIGFLRNTGNFERNRANYPGKRDESGRLLPIDDQPDYQRETLPEFLDRVSESEAAYYPGGAEMWKAHHNKKAQAERDATANAPVKAGKGQMSEKDPPADSDKKTETAKTTGKGKKAKTENPPPPADPDKDAAPGKEKVTITEADLIAEAEKSDAEDKANKEAETTA